MSRNGLFLISIGSLFVLLSYMMPTPIFLIVTGLVLIAAGIRLVRKESKLKKETKQ